MKAPTTQTSTLISTTIHPYQNFPKPGIQFFDIFTLTSNPTLLASTLTIFQTHLNTLQFDKFLMLQSRGFLFGIPLSLRMNKPCYPVRKKGKLPGEVITAKYGLQYGADQLQLQIHNINKGDRIVIVDDILATGGTINATIELIQKLEGIVTAIILVNVIKNINGIENIKYKDKIFYIADV